MDVPSSVESQLAVFRQLAKGRISATDIERAVDRARSVAHEFARNARNLDSGKFEAVRELTGEGWSITVSFSSASGGVWSRMKRALVG
ncbi:hypothetical protein [Roseiterribacter gracilis]|uniref:hypothetical protein n=1 Tax=Roseiterribacter gracilis TaxID=2812848 RepID=UPI003B42B699